MYQTLKLMLIALLLTSIVACKGATTGREYTTQEMTQISKFLDVSEQRLMVHKDWNIIKEELVISMDRLEEAVEFVNKK